METKVRVIELEEKAQYLIVCHAHITEERFPMSPVSVNSINLFLSPSLPFSPRDK